MFGIIGYCLVLLCGCYGLSYLAERRRKALSVQLDMRVRYRNHLMEKIQDIKIQIYLLEKKEEAVTEIFAILEKSASALRARDILKRVRNELRALENTRFYFRRAKASPKNSSFGQLVYPLYAETSKKLMLCFESLPEDLKQVMGIFIKQLNVCLEISHLYCYYQKLSISDGLTGVANKRYFLEKFDAEYSRAQKHGLPLSLIMMDIDDFKKYNDSYGHLYGDMVLKEIAEVAQQTIRTMDTVSRYGGEEFCVVLPETDLRSATRVAERIRENVARLHRTILNEPLRNVTLSLGIASYPRNTIAKEDLLNLADTFLYEAKKHGKNQVYYQPGAVLSHVKK